MNAPFDAGNARFRGEVRRFVARELAPRAEGWERGGVYPRGALNACGRRGYLALDDARTAVLAEELARCESAGVALSILVQAAMIAPLLARLGSPAQKKQFLAALHAGRRGGAMAVTEPDAGSDLAALRTEAVEQRGVFVVSGEKTYITSATAAQFLIVAARLPQDPDGLSLLLIPTGIPGVTIRPVPSLGLRPTGMGRVMLLKCRVPLSALLGEPGSGYGYVQEALNRERLFGGIGAVAWGAYAIEKTAAYLRTRRAFGRPISRFQAVRHQLADAATALEAARQLNYATFVRWSRGDDVMKEIAMIKLFTFRQAQTAIETCLQLHGGLGYRDDFWISRWYRDARALTIAAGTPEVMRDLIAACLRL